ncbi:MAG TPA: GNAT family N-acetyltransferase [Pyrinomonadaceae bacterium]|nr:GNAT family N-acetyltransferase [Pyrinomonadaceae bacterium]
MMRILIVSCVIPNLRRATDADADSIAEIYLRSRKELVACAPLVHSDQSVREWVRQELIPAGSVTVASVDGVVIGFVAMSRGNECSWMDQLYLLPTQTRRGIGTALLDHAKRELPSPIRLYTFQCNDAARQFYEHHGFRAVAYSDGSANEENRPDILYEWQRE